MRVETLKGELGLKLRGGEGAARENIRGLAVLAVDESFGLGVSVWSRLEAARGRLRHARCQLRNPRGGIV